MAEQTPFAANVLLPVSAPPASRIVSVGVIVTAPAPFPFLNVIMAPSGHASVAFNWMVKMFFILKMEQTI